MPRPAQPLRRKKNILAARERRRRWIRTMLMERGISVTALADHFGISRVQLSKGLYDRKPNLAQRHRDKLLKILGVDIYASYLPPEPRTEASADVRPAQSA